MSLTGEALSLAPLLPHKHLSELSETTTQVTRVVAVAFGFLAPLLSLAQFLVPAPVPSPSFYPLPSLYLSPSRAVSFMRQPIHVPPGLSQAFLPSQAPLL